jgi:hypothetical protein
MQQQLLRTSDDTGIALAGMLGLWDRSAQLGTLHSVCMHRSCVGREIY